LNVKTLSGTASWDKNSWFYTNGKNFYYFLGEINYTKEDIKGEYNLKMQSYLNLGNSERINSKCEVFRNGLTP